MGSKSSALIPAIIEMLTSITFFQLPKWLFSISFEQNLMAFDNKLWIT
jgi:hypothetical protein